jgi:carboxyl-terminal processing protease
MQSLSRTARRIAAAVALTVSLGAALSVQSVSASKTDRHQLDLLNEVIDQVRERYVDVPDDKKMIEGAVSGMLSALDPHSSYMTEDQFNETSQEISGEFGGVGLEVEAEGSEIRIVSVLDDTPAANAGLQSNDIITKIDGHTVSELSLEKAVDRMHGAPGSKVALTLTRKGVELPFVVTLKRDVIRVSPVKSHAEGTVGYIRVTTFNGQTADGVSKAVTKLKKDIGPGLEGYVLDLRNNPGGLLDQAIAVSDQFLAKGKIVSVRGRRPSDDESFGAGGSDITGGKPMVVLINGGTASAAEIVSGALQDDKRALVLGTRSFGKGTVQTIVPLGGGRGALRLTTARYYTPSGRSIQAKGIEPDKMVEEQVPDSAKKAAAADYTRGGEKALANHLKNPDGDADDDAADTDQPTSIAYVPDDPQSDTQLQAALSYLRQPAGAPVEASSAPSREVAAKKPETEKHLP